MLIPENIIAALAEGIAKSGKDVLLTSNYSGDALMIARRIPYFMPPLTDETAVEVARIHVAANVWLVEHATRWLNLGVNRMPQIKVPHYTISPLAMRGAQGKPGEVSLAHAGVLCLNAVDEFRMPVLGAVRDAKLAGTSAGFPSKFQLVGCMAMSGRGCIAMAGRGCSEEISIEPGHGVISGVLFDAIIHLPEVVDPYTTDLDEILSQLRHTGTKRKYDYLYD